MSDTFPIKNGLKQGDALLPFVFNLALEYAIRRVRGNDSLKLSTKLQISVYADNILDGCTHTTQKKIDDLIFASKEIGL